MRDGRQARDAEFQRFMTGHWPPRDDTDLAGDQTDAGDLMARADDRGALLAALAELPPRQREAETRTAHAMGCSVGTVKSSAAKGIAKLRALPRLNDVVTS
ncbi:hypothetical protein AB0912_13615 [Streptomyces sp. NPDC007084]|uniref:hypothetical protein n=1 Tax=Streptomyces sp. NPDC007084 TaxID=3154313 RepID=UPI0034549E43